MRGVKRQIYDSIPFARKVTPQFRNPEELWDWLKPKFTFKNDRPGYEQLQTMQTMFGKKNVHGVPGSGDCDCITISGVAAAITNQWDGISVVIAGRQKSHPVHIYFVIYWKHKRIVMDFTNRKYNYERSGYRYYQELPVHWRKW